MNARARRCLKIAALALVEAILVGGSGLPARAQFPDVLSEAECRGCAAQLAAALPLALVVEMRGARVNATERYSVSADGRWLALTLQLATTDKGARPTVLTKRWLRTPNARIAAHGCDVMSAGLEASLADYLDPRRIDARR